MKRSLGIVFTGVALMCCGCVHVGSYDYLWALDVPVGDQRWSVLWEAPVDPDEPIHVGAMFEVDIADNRAPTKTLLGHPIDGNGFSVTLDDGSKQRLRHGRGIRFYYRGDENGNVARGFVDRPVTTNQLLDYVGTFPDYYSAEGLRAFLQQQSE